MHYTHWVWCEAGPFTARRDDGRKLFDDLEIGLEPGALTVLDGPSGSGKTTLLRQLVGLNPAPSARRLLAGDDYPEAELPRWRSQVTLLTQDAPMLPGSIEYNLELGFSLRCSRDRRLNRHQLRTLLASSGLGELDLGREAGSLSGGERHRLALVRGLLWDPPVLVADEPLSGIDPETADACFELICAQARRADRSVLLVLHDPTRFAAADRRLTLSRPSEDTP